MITASYRGVLSEKGNRLLKGKICGAVETIVITERKEQHDQNSKNRKWLGSRH